MTEQPFRVFRHKQFIPKPDLPTDQAPITDVDTVSLSIVPGSPSLEASCPPMQFIPRPILPLHQASLADKDTMPHSAVHSSSPVGVPNTPQPNQYIQKPIDQAPMADQSTAPQTAVNGLWSATTSDKTTDKPPGIIRHMLVAGLARLHEPQPEGLLTRGLQAIRPGTGLGLIPALALTNACGLLLVSISYYMLVLEYSYPIVEPWCLTGLLMMIVPNLVRLLSRAPTRLERIALVCLPAGCCYLVQYMTSPAYFSRFDEFLHWRTANDILTTHHLFSDNSMLPASPYFPGLEILTNAVSTLTGSSTFEAGHIVIIVARLLMFLSLFLLCEQLTGSSRMASIAAIIYMANQHFIFFDASYSYETLALPLAMFMLYILVRYGNDDKNHRWVIGSAWIVLVALTITHHMTSYVVDGLLLLWVGVSLFQRAPHKTRTHLTLIATFSLLLSLIYALLLPGNPVWSYLSAYFASVFNQLELVIAGGSIARPLFTNSGHASPIWDKLFMTGSIVLITFSLPFGLFILQRQYRDNALATTFGIASLLYPLIQVFRFTSFGGELTDRAAAFLFLPIAYLLTIFIAHVWSTRMLNRRVISLITSAIAVIFLGGVLVGAGPSYLNTAPGSYMVVADARSVEPEGIEDARWSLTYLGQDNRVATDRINQMLMHTYGHQHVVTHLGDHIDVSPIFYSGQFDNTDIEILQHGQIHYLIVDTRISTALPLEETYFESDRPTSIINRNALTKFNNITTINRIFDSGNIIIYDTRLFINNSHH